MPTPSVVDGVGREMVVPRLFGGVAPLLVLLRPGVSGADPAGEARCELAEAMNDDASNIREPFGVLTLPKGGEGLEVNLGMPGLGVVLRGV